MSIIINNHNICISGCSSCPFCHYDEEASDYNPHCIIDFKLNIKTSGTNPVDTKLPVKCPLRHNIYKLSVML